MPSLRSRYSVVVELCRIHMGVFAGYLPLDFMVLNNVHRLQGRIGHEKES